MASLALSFNSFNLTLPLSAHPAGRPRRGSLQLAPFAKVPEALRLSFTHSISRFSPIRPHNLFTLSLPAPRNQPFTVFAAKGYKMKTHKASAKRFRVTGRGKIVRRRAGKQHLLAKKNTKRKLRLSKIVAVDRSDYDNVISCMPYLKVNRKAK